MIAQYLPPIEINANTDDSIDGDYHGVEVDI